MPETARRLRRCAAAMLAGLAVAAAAEAAVPADPRAALPIETQAEWPKPVDEALANDLDTRRPLDAAVLDAVRSMTEGMAVGAPPKVVRQDDGALTLRLTDLTVPLDGSVATVPFVEAVMSLRDRTRLAITLDMAQEIRQPDIVTRMDAPQISSVYDTDLDTMVQSRVRLSNIVTTSTDPAETGAVRIGAVTASEDLEDGGDRLDGRGDITVSGIAITDETGGGLTIGSLSGAYTLSEMDRAAYLGIAGLMALAERGGPGTISDAELMTALADLRWSGLDGTVAVSNVAVQAVDGQTVATLDMLRLAVTSANPTGTGDLRLSLTADDALVTEAGWAEIAAADPAAPLPPRELVPQDLSLTATAESLPIADLFRAGAAGAEGTADRVATVLGEAGTTLYLSDMALKAPEAAVTGNLTLKPLAATPGAAAAEGSFVVTGLDRLLAAVNAMQPTDDTRATLAALLLLKGMGEPAPEGDGLVYRVDHAPETGLTVNEVPLGAMLREE